MKFILGAYATAPSLGNLSETEETIYYSELVDAIPEVRGLEIPFWGDNIHEFGDEYLLNIIKAEWQNVLTCIPGTMKALSCNKKFGLASDDNDGRNEAINMHRKANLAVHKLNKLYGDQSVVAVQIATAPSVSMNGVLASKSSLLRSLEEILSWDWLGSKIVIEHCDSYSNKQPCEKGFFSLDDEIEVLESLNDSENVGLTINWGRSTIEGRNSSTAIEHIKSAVEKNILSGLIFSGASNMNTDYGVWKDTHMPFNTAYGIKYHEPDSLLTKENIVRSLEAMNSKTIDYIGIKLLSMPIAESTTKRRVGINRDAITVLNNIIN